MPKVANMIVCDWCEEEMDIDETGIHCMAHTEGGHAVCGAKHFKEVH